MQPSFRSLRCQAPQQARCRCAAIRVRNSAQTSIVDPQPQLVSVSFKVHYKCNFGQTVALVGNAAELGQWSSRRGLRMRWGQGDEWTCTVKLPAGSSFECKYVVVDDKGGEVRWQEGHNMAVQVPAAFQGLSVQQYDVHVSWCQTVSNFKALPVASGIASSGSKSDRASERAATFVAAAAAVEAGSSAAPTAAWALAKGAGAAPAARKERLAEATVHTKVTAKAAANGSAAAVAAATSTTVNADAAEQKSAGVSSPSQQQQQQQQAASQGAAPLSLAETIRQAAASAAQTPAMTAAAPAAATPIAPAATATATATPAAAAAAAAPAAAIPAAAAAPPAPFQLTPASNEEPMSLVLPPRSTSPPVKISLSSSFSKLMEMPGSPRGAAAAASPAPAPGNSGGNAGGSGSVGSTGWNSISGKPPTPAVHSHPIDAPVVSAAPTGSAAAGAGGAAAPVPSSRTPGSGSSSSSSSAAREAPVPASFVSASWGHEYDIYSAAYDTPYMHTAFDLDAYAVYEQIAPEPAPSPSRAAGFTTGAGDLLSRGAALLESAVQAACGTTTPASAPSPVVAAAAAPTAAAARSAPVSPPPLAAPSPSPAAAPVPPSSDPYSQSARPSPASSPSSVNDWASRTLFELSSLRGLGSYDDGDDSDDDETADDEAALVHAMAAPVSPADMAALLTQLGAALGRSVRLRYEGMDVAASDLLELDRKIALATSKLYRQRDTLLTGWVRKETRRQLAASPAVAAAAAVGGSNLGGGVSSPGRSVTPM